jgi:hypothetical protein
VHNFLPGNIALSAALLLVPLAALHAADAKPKILFIAVDDLRPWIGAIGLPAATFPAKRRLRSHPSFP